MIIYVQNTRLDLMDDLNRQVVLATRWLKENFLCINAN